MINVSLKKLKWLAFLAPALFIGAFEFITHSFFHQINKLWLDLADIIFIFGTAFLFSHFIFGIIDRLQKNIEERNNELSAINKIALALGRSLSLDEILSTTLEELHNSFRDAGIALYIRHESKLHLVDKKGLFKDLPLNFVEISGVPQEKTSGFVEALKKGSPVVGQDNNTGHTVYLPLRSRKDVLGIVLVCRNSPFSSGVLEALNTISNQVGFSIENARLHSQTCELATIEERERIAREIHDGLAQILGYVTLKASIAQRLLAVKQVAQAESEVKEIEKVTQEAYVDAREAILGLRTCMSKEGGFIKTLSEYISRFKLSSGIKVELDTNDGQDLKLTFAEEIQLIRIIQEALTNVRKHAKAGKAWVRFKSHVDCTQLIIEDNGQGFDIARMDGKNKSRYGLQTMQERAEKIGAAFQVTSFIGLGTKIEVKLPGRNKAGVEVETYESASR